MPVFALERRKVLISEILMALAYLSLAIISSYHSMFTVQVPFPGISVFLFLFGLSSLARLNLREIRVHSILFVLFFRLLLFCLNGLFLKVGPEKILEESAVTVISALIFLVAYNADIRIKNVLTPFIFLTDLQIFYTFASGGFSMDKSLIVAGIGDSNYIASFLLLYICFLLFMKKKPFDILLIGISIIAMLLTQSFACYLALGVVLFIWVIKTVNWKSKNSVLFFLVLLLLLVLLFALFLNTKFGQPIYEKVKEKLNFLSEGNFTAFSSSRNILTEFSIKNILRHPFFGTIINTDPELPVDYRWQGFRTHNFALESLLLYGIVGSILNLFILYFLIRSFRCKKNLPYLMAFLGALVHGLFEPNFFTLHFELFLWLMIGISLRNADCPGGCRLFGKKQRKE